jgi:hypothetical protein
VAAAVSQASEFTTCTGMSNAAGGGKEPWCLQQYARSVALVRGSPTSAEAPHSTLYHTVMMTCRPGTIEEAVNMLQQLYHVVNHVLKPCWTCFCIIS